MDHLQLPVVERSSLQPHALNLHLHTGEERSLQAPICIAHRHLGHPHLHRLLLLGHCFPRTHLLHPEQSVDHLQLPVVKRSSLQPHAGEERRRRCFDTISRKRWTKRR